MATILLIMILCVSNIFIVKVKAQENNKEAIINFTNNYFAKRMDMLSKLQMDDSIKNYLLNDNDYYELDTVIKYRKLQIGDLRLKKVDQKVEINNIDIDNNKAKVEVLLDEKISFNDTPDIVSEEVNEHDLTLIYTNNEWKIQDDDFNSDFKELFAEQSSNTAKKVRSVNNNKLESVQEQILKETQEEVLNEKNELEKIKSENDSEEENVKQVQTRAAQFKFKKYDREAAATYARKYAKTPNKNYLFYGNQIMMI